MNKLDNPGLQLVSVGELLGQTFIIPSYQRGYRWKERQVTDLLNDIFEFQKKPKKQAGEFYCLQPIVVAQNGTAWRVIDGQQRLTTLSIILKYLEQVKDILYPNRPLFSLEYETRQGSKQFLEHITQQSAADIEYQTQAASNADFYHIALAYRTIQKWFEEKDAQSGSGFNRGDFLAAFLKTDYQNETFDGATNVRFIWYNIGTADEAAEKTIFQNINRGKIPLTNAELIKAVFFLSSSSKAESADRKEKRHNQLAYEWNEIEDALQNNDFWFFLTTAAGSSTRIDFLFELLADTLPSRSKYSSSDAYRTFYIFQDAINKNPPSADALWTEIKTYYRTFKEWFENDEYYHKIGYLVRCAAGSLKDIHKKLLKESCTQKKADFKLFLNTLIQKTLAEATSLETLSYLEDKDKPLLSRILLLFNIVSTMKSGYQRFPFQQYVTEKWSLEHIHAQQSEALHTEEEQRAVLKEQYAYYEAREPELAAQICELLGLQRIDTARFTELQNRMFAHVSAESDSEQQNDTPYEDIHGIDNLALLSQKDNSALSNNIFPIKRDIIIAMDRKGAFIPLCTKNVFLKYYSTDVTQNALWTKKDRDSYMEKISEYLKDYLPKTKGESNE